MRNLLELGGRRLPFLRWSAIRMVIGARKLTSDWQVGDGREKALEAYVREHARAGDVDDVVRVIDEFCYRRSIMMNVGDEKGQILDDAIRRVAPRLVLELGAYCGYSALRMSRVLDPDSRLVSVELSAANAAIARRIWDHAGVGERITVVVGHLGDGGATADLLEREYAVLGGVDAVFLDHEKSAYVTDLELMVARGWLHAGTVVVADNVKVPGAPKYRAFMREKEGKDWRTVEHETHLEYQTLIKDLVLESVYTPEP